MEPIRLDDDTPNTIMQTTVDDVILHQQSPSTCMAYQAVLTHHANPVFIAIDLHNRLYNLLPISSQRAFASDPRWITLPMVKPDNCLNALDIANRIEKIVWSIFMAY